MKETPPNSPEGQVEMSEPRIAHPLFTLMEDLNVKKKKTLYFQFNDGELHKVCDVEPGGCELVFKKEGDFILFSEGNQRCKVFIKDNE